MHSKTAKGYLFAILSAVIYGCMPLMANYAYADGVNPLTLVFFRNMFSILPLGILAYRDHKSLKIPQKLLPSISIIALVGCCATPVLLLSSYRFIPSGAATVFHFAYPAIVIVSEILFLRKKPQPVSIISVLFCIVGLSLFYEPRQTLNLTGSALALLSAVTFASYVVLVSRFDNSHVSGFLFTFYVTLISSVVLFAVCLVTNSFSLPTTAAGWGLCVLFSLLITTGAVVLFQQGIFLIGGQRASILSTLEPITSIVIGFLVFSEPLGIRIISGTVLVVGASILTALADIKKTSKNA